jgi:signal transduction histidine kinase
MKFYLLSFISLIILIVVAISSIGIVSTLRAVRSFDAGEAGADLGRAGESLARLYKGTADPDVRGALEDAADAIDRSRARLSQVDALKGHLFEGFTVNIVLVALLCLAAGFLLWLGTYVLFIKPIAGTIREINAAGGESALRAVTLRGVRELRFLQASLNGFLEKIEAYRKRIRQIERENIGRFLVHQIRNCVTPIELSASSVKRMPGGSAEISGAMDLVLSEAGKISDLMDRFRALYKFPAMIPSEIELNAFVRTVASRFPGIRAEPAPADVVIRADRNLLEQAVGNVVQNGLDAAGGNAAAVRVSVEPGFPPCLIVSDEGRGMTEEERFRMFDEYYTTKPAGTGIGLAFVKLVMDKHGFRIGVESVEGKGTTVRMVFHG